MTTKSLSIAGVTITTSIHEDPDSEDPRTWESLGLMSIFEDKKPFWDKANSVFGSRAEEMVPQLADGDVCWDSKGRPTLGIERYRHGGDVLAISKTGSFPDRRWDVSPIVGFWTINESDNDLLSEARKLHASGDDTGVKRVLIERASSDLEVLNQWMSGDVWGYSVEVKNSSGEVLGEDSCYGIYGREYAETEAAEAKTRLIGEHQIPEPELKKSSDSRKRRP